MPPVRDVDAAFMLNYIGGEIIFPTVEGSNHLNKGEVVDCYIEDAWLIVRIILKEKAEGDIKDLRSLEWKPTSRSVQELSLSRTAYVNTKEMLTFMPDPRKGSLAFITHP